MAKTGEKTWIMEIRPAVTDPLLSSSPDALLLTASQPSLGYAFYDMAVLVQALLTDATNLNETETHRSMNTMCLYCCYMFVQKGI